MMEYIHNFTIKIWIHFLEKKKQITRYVNVEPHPRLGVHIELVVQFR
jgi:hypothetical protein